VSAIGDDATGEISSGELLIKAHGLYGGVRYLNSPGPFARPYLELQYSDGLVIALSDRMVGDCNYAPKPSGISGLKVFWDYDITALDQHHVPNGTEVLAILIEKYSNEIRNSHMSAWLVLRPGQEAGSFERIGFLQIRDYGLIELQMEISKLDRGLETRPEIEIKIV
jgi:hypothetical protein